MDDRPFLTEQEAADYLDIPVKELRQKTIPCVKHGRWKRYIRSDLEHWGRPKPAPGFVYFILSPCTQYVKIGYATDVDVRMRDLQIANPEPLELLEAIPAGPEKERELHQKYIRLRHRGEWFRFTPDLEEDIYELGEKAAA